MKYRACIFDLDGTTADSVEAIAHTANECLKQVGLEERPIESYKMFAGDGQFELISRALIDAGDIDLQHYDAVLAMYIEKFATGCTYHIKTFMGIPEMLMSMKNQGIKIAILSNKRHHNAISVVEQIYGSDMFDIVLGQKDSYTKKPCPEGAYIIAETLGLKPEECLYIGDTDVDMQTGSNAGMDTVGVTWGFRSREELVANKATFIVDEPKEILELL